MRRIVPLLATLILAAATGAVALAGHGMAGGAFPSGPPLMGGPGGPGGPGAPPFERDLYPPELVLSNQLAIGLTEDQSTAIKRLLNETHSRIIDLQVDIQKVTERLTRTLEPARVDEAAALAAAEQAMALESQMKKAHLTLLVRMKNLLTEDQQAKLDTLRPHRPEGPGAARP